MREHAIQPGHILTGTLCSEPMRVETVRAHGPGVWEMGLVGVQSERFRKVTLTSQDIEALAIQDTLPIYAGDGRLLRWGSRPTYLASPTSLIRTSGSPSPVSIRCPTSLKRSTIIGSSSPGSAPFSQTTRARKDHHGRPVDS
jgi:hypothetical protein